MVTLFLVQLVTERKFGMIGVERCHVFIVNHFDLIQQSFAQYFDTPKFIFPLSLAIDNAANDLLHFITKIILTKQEMSLSVEIPDTSFSTSTSNITTTFFT